MMFLVILIESRWLSMFGTLLERSVEIYIISKILYVPVQKE